MIALLPDDQRDYPQTRPDDECRTHKATCTCIVCARPGSMALKKKHWNLMHKARHLNATP